jgi:hypothetical protein
MNKPEIEKDAKRLRREIFRSRHEIWPDREPHPFEMVDPEVAAHVLGLAFHSAPDLSFTVPGRKYETAGILDRQKKSIAVATRFGLDVARFTAAHEIGHWLRHPNDLHFRDAPIKGLEREVQDPKEREADHFAALFLMPPHFVRKIFGLMFLTDKPFVFDERTINLLGRAYDTEALLYPERDSMLRERALTSTKKFNGQYFEKSLAEMFHVSVGTMAIRIQELELVRPWP